MNKWYIVLFVFSVFISSVSQILLKKSTNIVRKNIFREYFNLPVIISYALFFLSTLLTVVAYKNVPLSLGPILESLGYVFVTSMSFFFLKEKITLKQLFGIVLILLGIIVASLGNLL